MYTIGIDLGGTNIAAGLVDENYNIVKKSSVDTKADRHADEIVKDMAQLCRSLCDMQGISTEEVKSVGIATPGTADRDHGVEGGGQAGLEENGRLAEHELRLLRLAPTVEVRHDRRMHNAVDPLEGGLVAEYDVGEPLLVQVPVVEVHGFPEEGGQPQADAFVLVHQFGGPPVADVNGIAHGLKNFGDGAFAASDASCQSDFKHKKT